MTTDTTKTITPANRAELVADIGAAAAGRFWPDEPTAEELSTGERILARLEAAGVVCVPANPTDEQARAGCAVPLNKAARHNLCYRSMVAASPYAKEG